MISSSPGAALAGLVHRCIALFGRIPYSLIAFLGRFSIAAVFWLAGQTKVEGLAINLVNASMTLGWPHLTDSAISLFETEYALPLLPPALAALLAAIAEHVFAIMLLLGLGSRFAALGLLGMTAVIEVFVYPDAYPTHGTWAAVLLLILWRGPGWLSLDHWISRRCGAPLAGR